MASSESKDSLIAWLPDLIFTAGRFETGLALVCDRSGVIARLARVDELKDEKKIRLSNRAMLPGMVNAHSHAFQRVLRGRTEHRTSDQQDSFWTWREMMYSAATRLTPEDIYDASRLAFLEMVLNGITAVGEFHYLHHARRHALRRSESAGQRSCARSGRCGFAHRPVTSRLRALGFSD